MRKIMRNISMFYLFGLFLTSCTSWKIKTQEQSLERLPIYFERIEKLLDEKLGDYEKEEVLNQILDLSGDAFNHIMRYQYTFDNYQMYVKLTNYGSYGRYSIRFESMNYEDINEVKKIPTNYIEMMNDVGLICCTKKALGPGSGKFLELEERLYSNKENFIGDKSVSEIYYWNDNPVDQYQYNIKYEDGFYYTMLLLSDILMKNI